MAHVIADKKKLLQRVKRIRGQIDGLEKALNNDEECYSILLTISSVRGALMGLMGELLEEHMFHHVLDERFKPKAEQSKSARELMDAVKTFLKS